MPAPRWLARFNRRVTNRLTAPLVGHVRGLGLIEHTGRRTRRRYRTPVLVFSHSSRCVIALTYGPQTDWVQNVLAEGGCTLATMGQRLRLVHPRLIHADGHRYVPPAIGVVLRVAGISDFIELEREPVTDR